jgi:hypothetical protein
MSTSNNEFHLFVLKNYTIGNIKKIDERITLIPRKDFVIASVKQTNHLPLIESDKGEDLPESYNFLKSGGKYFFEPLEYLKQFLSSYQLSNDDTIKNFDCKIDQQSRPSFSKFKMKVMPIISNDYPIIKHDESEILNLEKINVREGAGSDLWIVDIDSRRISSSDISWVMCDNFDESSFQKYYEFSQKVQSILDRSGTLIDELETKQALKNILFVYQNAKEGKDFRTSVSIFIMILETLFASDNKINQSLKKRISKIFSEFTDDVENIIDGCYSFRSDIVHLNRRLQFSYNQIEFTYIKRYIASMCSILIRYFVDKIHDDKHYTIKKFRNSIIADSDFWDGEYFEEKTCSNCALKFFQKNIFWCSKCNQKCMLEENRFQCSKCGISRYHKCLHCRYKYSPNWYDQVKSENTDIETVL